LSSLNVDTINEKTTGNGVIIPGHVVQTKHMTFPTNTTFATQSVWADTGLTQDITVKQGNKILVSCDVCSGQLYTVANMGMYMRLLVGSEVISNQHIEEHHGAGYVLRNNTIQGMSSTQNAGTVTVKCQVYVLPVGTAYFRFNWTSVGESHLTVMEIAQ
jgi:hypothetical protein